MSHFHSLVKEQPKNVVSLNLGDNMSTVLIKKRQVEVKPMPMQVLQPDGVLVKVITTGICGSDMHNYLAGGVGGRPIPPDLVLGHESCGEVIAVGELVTSHKVGDRVAIEPGLPCRRCKNCKAGRSNICWDMKYCGAPGSIGSLSKYYALPSDMAPKIPASVDWDVAGSIQPLAIGVHIGRRIDLRAHQTVAIFGCGPIGLISAAVAHSYGCRRILAFEINPARVEFAKKYISPLTGKPIIDHVFLNKPVPTTPQPSSGAANGQSHPDVSENGHGGGLGDGETKDDHEDDSIEGDRKWDWAKVMAADYLKQAGLDEEDGVDRVIEATGTEDCGMLGVAIAKQGGILLAVGLGHHSTQSYPMIPVTNKELDIRGTTRYTPGCFQGAIDLLERNVVDLKQLITISFPMSKAGEAFEAVASGKQMKVLIKNQEC